MSAHAEFLRAASQDASLASQIKTDFRQAQLSQRDLRMLEFVEKLTRFPWLLVEGDVRLLRQAGFTETEILHIVLGNAHFNYLNRMADGIGIRFEYKSDLPEFKKHQPERTNEARHENGGTSQRSLNTPPNHRPTAQTERNGSAWISFRELPELKTEPDEPRNLYLVMAENPEAQELTRSWRRYQLLPTPYLDARLRARLALYISGLNRCDYSIFWFQRNLSSLGEDPAICHRLAKGEVPPNLSRLEQHLFEHAERLTHEPWMTEEKHIQGLRADGLDDRAILQLTMLASYLSFENRVALGLGIPLESNAR